MKKTAFVLLLILGAVLMMANSASAGPARGGGTGVIHPTTAPQPFQSAT